MGARARIAMMRSISASYFVLFKITRSRGRMHKERTATVLSVALAAEFRKHSAGRHPN
jgi:hypothetical protein